MKKLCLLTVLGLLIFKVHSAEKMNQNNYNYGQQSYGKQIVSFIKANGSVVLKGTKVLD